MSMPFKPLLSIDFDGVLHSYSSGWKGARVIPDPPVPGAIKWLGDLYEDGRFTLAIFSARSKSLTGRWAMKAWLRRALAEEYEHMIGPSWEPMRLEVFEAVKWPWFKPSAFLTIDDRALTFSGVWSEYEPADLLAFKPWNKRPSAA